MERKLNPDRSYIALNGQKSKLHGRSLLLVRNVGHLMTTHAITLTDGSEGMLSQVLGMALEFSNNIHQIKTELK